jgi:AbrB family looped-hinge helix DNA binding protein
MRKLVKQLRHGQITIPKEFGEALGLDKNDLLSIALSGGKLEIEPVKVTARGKGAPWARELYQMFAPVQASLEGYSEEENNQAIDEAVREVRGRKG